MQIRGRAGDETEKKRKEEKEGKNLGFSRVRFTDNVLSTPSFFFRPSSPIGFQRERESIIYTRKPVRDTSVPMLTGYWQFKG